MKSTRKCPKCNSTEIYTDEGLSKSGDRASIPVSGWSKFFVATYICMNCGFIEEYIEKDDLSDKKKREKLEKNWKKI